MRSLIKVIVLSASLSAAMPYSVDFPSITLEFHPTISHATINKSHMPTSSFFNQTTSYTLVVHPTFRPAVNSNDNTNGSLGACGLGIGACPTGLCCSGYGYCGSNSSYCGTNCQPDFGTCNSNATIPLYSLSYKPLSTYTSLFDNTGVAGIITGDAASSSTVAFSYVSENTSAEEVSTITLPTMTGIFFDPVSTTYTAIQFTWAATSYKEAAMTTAFKKIGCAANATSSKV